MKLSAAINSYRQATIAIIDAITDTRIRQRSAENLGVSGDVSEVNPHAPTPEKFLLDFADLQRCKQAAEYTIKLLGDIELSQQNLAAATNDIFELYELPEKEGDTDQQLTQIDDLKTTLRFVELIIRYTK